MSKHIDKSWTVFVSVETFEHDRCVDIFSRPDGSYGFEEFRLDIEDGGQWSPYTTTRALPTFHQPMRWTLPNDVYLGWSTSSPGSRS